MSGLKKLLMWAAVPRGVVEKTITGNPVTFRTKLTEAMSMVIPFSPIQAGTGDPSPENVRAISGIDGLNIYATGKNLLDFTDVTEKTYLKSDGTTGSSNSFVLTNYIPVTGAITISGDHVRTQSACIGFYDANKGFIEAQATQSVMPETFTLPNGTKFIRVSLRANPVDGQGNENPYQIEYGTTATTYEAFGTTRAVTFTEAGTVYGGTLTVNADGTGKLVVDTGFVKLTSVSQLTGFSPHATVGAMATIANDGKENTGNICSICPFVKNADRTTTAGINRVYVSSSVGVVIRAKASANVSTVEELFAIFENGEFAYELKTPVEYTLSIEQVATVSGLNNVWTDTNGINTVTYKR